MTCREIARRLPGYLDGAVSARDSSRVREHIEVCADCRRFLENYRRLSVAVAQVEPIRPPADLVARIRAQASRERARREESRRLWSRARLFVENILEPLAVPATGGLATALLAFAILVQSLLVGMPMGAVPNDLPTNLLQPARLESLAPFPVSGFTTEEGHGVLMVQALLNERGEVVNYEILSGPDSATVRHQLDQVLLFSRFRPQMSFGRPTARGLVVLSFSEVRVKG
jgi:hypothetical protein